MTGRLFLVGTPIGNLGDITLRALETLKSVDVIASEDTRHTRILLERYGIAKRVISYYRQKERAGSEEILTLLAEGKSVALVSDAGMPCISDPGAVVVARAREAGYPVETVPGPTAVTTAAAYAGLETGFVFLGFLPEKKKERAAVIEGVKNIGLPLIFYCAPHDLEKTIGDLRGVLGDRKLASVKELTKLHESLYAGTLSDPAIDNEKGEFVLIVYPGEGAGAETVDPKAMLNKLLAEGMRRSEAVKAVAEATGMSRNQVYAIGLDDGRS